MHYAPTVTETRILKTATNEQRLDYFITRSMECEEVWGLCNAAGWVIKEDGGICILPVWSYAVMAQTCALEDWSDHKPDSISLEHFVYTLLGQLLEQEIQVEILPSPECAGLVIEANALFEIFERKLDTAEYFIEG